MNKIIILLPTTILPFTACQNQQKQQAKTKPNIVYILADDLGYGDLSCYGQTHFEPQTSTNWPKTE